MNIFYTNPNPAICAMEHCDRHMVKMILEYAQMLSTAHHVYGSWTEPMYKPTHKNHPSSMWVRESNKHYMWLYCLYSDLLNNFEMKTGRKHASSKLQKILKNVPTGIPYNGFVPPPACVPEHFKTNNILESYQNCMIDKFTEWQSREKPLKVEWWHGIIPEWYDYSKENRI